MIKDLINPTQFNVLVSKLGDILVKVSGQAIGLCHQLGKDMVFMASTS